MGRNEVAFAIVMLGTLKYQFVELIAATVIFDCAWGPKRTDGGLRPGLAVA